MSFEYFKVRNLSKALKFCFTKGGIPVASVGALKQGLDFSDVCPINVLEFISTSIHLILYLMLGIGLTILILLFYNARKAKRNKRARKLRKYLVFVWNIFIFIALVLIAMYIELKTIDYSSDGYANAVHGGDLFTAEEFFSGFNSPKDFVATVQLENPEKYPQSILVYALEKQTQDYQQVFELAKKYGFTFNQKIPYNYYKDNNRLQPGKYTGKIFWLVSEDYLGIKYNGEYTISQYLFGLSHADFNPEYLAFLQQSGINFEEGIALRKELVEFLRSDDCKSNLYELDENKNFQEVYHRILEDQQSVLKTLQDFYNK